MKPEHLAALLELYSQNILRLKVAPISPDLGETLKNNRHVSPKTSS